MLRQLEKGFETGTDIRVMRTIWAECAVCVEAMGEQAAAVMTSYSHRDR